MDWPPIIWDAGQYETIGEDAATSEGTTVTTGTSGNTKGSWVQLVASSAFWASGLLISFIRSPGTNIDFLFDIGVGAAAAEKVVVPNLQWNVGSYRSSATLFLPLEIAAGSRVAARAQAHSFGPFNPIMQCTLVGRGGMLGPSFQRAAAIGASTADSGGVSVDPGATINTKGAYSQLVASCTNPVRGLILSIGNQANSFRSTAVWLLDVAVGAAASEKIIIPDLPLTAHSATHLMDPQFFSYLPCSIPAGSRIAARAQCSINDATDRLFDLSAIGFG